MPLQPNALPVLIDAVAEALRRQARAISELDEAIGDGDHLLNLQRGVAALQARAGDWTAQTWPDALRNIGMTLMSTVGGASGSLFGTLFIAMAKHWPEAPDGLAGFADAFGVGVEAVKLRGKSDVGQKTLLDVLVPVAAALDNLAIGAADFAAVRIAVMAAASAGLESTRDLIAGKGRAATMGERARGFLDPGALSSQVMIGAILEALDDL